MLVYISITYMQIYTLTLSQILHTEKSNIFVHFYSNKITLNFK